MRIIKAILFALLLVAVGVAQERSELSQPPNGNNQKAEVSQWIGLVKVSVEYHSPRVHFPPGNDRTGHIWGEVVHYGFVDEGFGPTQAAPWRAGANETTTLSFSHDVKVAGHDVPAGTYGLLVDVEKDGPWNWILSRRSYGWGSYQYEPKDEVLRVAATPQDAPFTEFLTYGFDDRRPDAATLFLQWENKRVSLPIDVPNVNELYVLHMRKELESWPGFDYQNWQGAAQFAADNKVHLDEALEWADKAIHSPFRGAALGHEDFSTLSTKAAVLTAMGRDEEADALMLTALDKPGAELIPVHQYGMRLLNAGKKEKALAIFKANAARHPEEKFFTYAGLARAYTALGDKPKAIANWETALKNVPPSQQANRARFEKALQDLKQAK